MPKVSVILPTYNRAASIDRAIESVLNQTYRDFELIIVDDGSTDDTEEVVKRFSDDRVHYTRHQVNRGASAARNIGLEMAKGELIAFQDSDDEWLSHKLQRQVEIFDTASYEVGVVYGDMNVIDEYGKEYLWKPIQFTPEDGIVYDRLLSNLVQLTGEMNFRGSAITFVTSVIRKNCFCDVGGFDESLPRWIDMDLFIRISRTYSFYYMDEPLINSFVLMDGITVNTAAGLEAKAVMLHKYMDDLSKNTKILGDMLYDIGSSSCYMGNYETGKEYLLRAARARPWNPRYIWTLSIAKLGERMFKSMTALKRKVLDRYSSSS